MLIPPKHVLEPVELERAWYIVVGDLLQGVKNVAGEYRPIDRLGTSCIFLHASLELDEGIPLADSVPRH